MLAIAILVVLLLIVLNGLFAMTELALVSSRKAKLQSRAERGDKGARAALRLAENPTHFLSAVQVGITLIGILAGAYGQAAIAGQLNVILERSLPAIASWSEALATGVVVILITYVSLIVGELVPKRLALIFPEAIAAKMASPISRLALVLKPFVSLLTLSTSGILRLMGVKDRDGSDVTQEEVETMIAEGTSAGLIEPEEQEMIEEILTLGDRPIRVAMTPRHEVFWIALDDSEAQLREEIRTCPYSRIVVARESDVDNPLGVVHKKDLLDSLLDNGEFNVERHVQEPAFIPQTTSVLKALEILKGSKVHMAFIVDEYGAFEGVVTATDLLEMIAGDFNEEHDEPSPNIVPDGEGAWLVDGRTDLDELSEILGEDFGESDGFHTVAGLILHQLSRIPDQGEVLQVGRFEVEVLEMEDRRIDSLRFRQAAPAPQPDLDLLD
ncbi:hemolysin family protein [Brevundimonas sp. 2R-24]|uniref:Hemolysin family protein n=1 Tax=Peiella sedimenti TaxID=3061083 RepID=A0ABT8SJN2_9CAUL|nr:hemolysin family protein [Caulobacteraceae bacterium XZ-24]